MMKKHLIQIRAVASHKLRHFREHKKSLASVTVGAFLLAFFGVVGVYGFQPFQNGDRGGSMYAAELAFGDLSPLGITGGRVLPASCESGLGEGGVAHFVGDTEGVCTPPIPPPLPTAWLTQSKASTVPNEMFNLTWGSTDAVYCTREYKLGSGSWEIAATSTPPSGSIDVFLLVPGTWQIRVTCFNQTGSGFAEVTHIVVRAPIVITDAASLITASSATLNGHAYPMGFSSTGWFRYDTVSANLNCPLDSGGTRVPASGGTALGSGTARVDFSNPISGLSPNTTYYYCAIAQNVNGTGFGTIASLTTIEPSVVAYAGPDMSITLPTTNTPPVSNAFAIANDPGASIVSTVWSQRSGPVSGIITNGSTLTPSFSALTIDGSYIFRLTATDNFGATAFDEMQVVVIPTTMFAECTNGSYAVGRSPENLTFDNVTNSVWVTNRDDNTVSKLNALTGATIGTYPVGSSPENLTFDNVTNSVWVANRSANTVSKLNALTGATIGTYPVGKSPQAITFDNVTNSVWTANNGANTASRVCNPSVPPTADAGPDQILTLPTNSTTLTGTASDPDGSIASTLWSKFYGPVEGVITSPNALTTTITGLEEGVYTYLLTATDNSGATFTDDVQVTVLPFSPVGCAYGTDSLGNALTLLNLGNPFAEPATEVDGKYYVDRFGTNYCFGNSGSLRYLVPLNTLAEFLSFYDNIEAGTNLSGLYLIP